MEPVNVSTEQKNAVVDALIARIGETYAFPDRGPELQDMLRRLKSESSFAGITDALMLAAELTAALRAAADDLHFSVSYDPAMFDVIGGMGLGPNPNLRAFEGEGNGDEPSTPAAGWDEAMAEQMRRSNYSFRKLEILDGNVGYMSIDNMPPLELAKPTLDAAMQFLSNTDALIIDLRDTPGGVGGFIPYLMSFFFPEAEKVLFAREFAWAGQTDTYKTVRDVGGPRFLDQDVYILTNGRTGSAAENLAYTLQQHGRATVVGEHTVGAAHSAGPAQLAHGFVAGIPIARVVHPVSNSNWNGTGVIPDLESTSQTALDVAHLTSLEALLDQAEDPNWESSISQAMQGVRSRMAARDDQNNQSGQDLGQYVGTYASRKVSVVDGSLSYLREGSPALKLARIEGDLFKFDLAPNMRSPVPLPNIRFDRNANGQVIGISMIAADGSVVDVFPKE